MLRGLLEGRPGGGHGGTRGEAGSGRGLGAGERRWRSSAIPGHLCLIPSAGVAGQVRPGSHLFTEGGGRGCVSGFERVAPGQSEVMSLQKGF